MPKQNRVTPDSQIITTSARGTLMGNRGVLHDEQQRIRRPFRAKRWIFCQLSFKGRRRQVMAPNRYTELFFLDEATALAAGHRPCAECMRPHFNEFREVWAAANPDLTDGPLPKVDVIDAALHRERLANSLEVPIDSLPDGAFISFGSNMEPYLLWSDRLLLWTPAGYTQTVERPTQQIVEVLTPSSVIRTIKEGFVPTVHPSAYQVLSLE